MMLSQMTAVSPYFGLAPWVVFFPLIGLLLNLLVGKRLDEVGIGWIASLASGFSFVVSVVLAILLWQQPQAVVAHLANWIQVGGLDIRWDFRVDTLSVMMMLVVSGVGTLIHIYAVGYMHHDVRHNGETGRYSRFFVYLNLFIAAMMILVSANNYLMLFVGWEGVGLCSYLLIGFWYEKGLEGIANARAAKKAFIVNRIGDFGLLIAMFLIFLNFKSLGFDDVFSAAAQVPQGIILAITLLMLLGVAGKSAQLPLYVWLPDAMAGPTPVSALIHAATMVTAGVYLVARSHALFALAPTAQAAVTWTGALTALFAATIAVGQTDIKKVLAYSTISQLGFMVAAVGMGALVAGMFHLVTHAFFKALLFLSAGSVILGMEAGGVTKSHNRNDNHEIDPQDMRNMGGLYKKMPVTFVVYLVGALALSGIAPLAGFFSKDEILTAAFHNNLAVMIILLISAFLTAFYMGRQVMLVFFGQPRSSAAQTARENSAIITVPLLVLAALSALGGALNLPWMNNLGNWLAQTFGAVEPEAFLWPMALGSLAVAFTGLLIAWLVYSQRKAQFPGEPDPLRTALGPIYTGMEHKWWVDELYHGVIVRPYQWLAQFTALKVDLGVIDGISAGLAKLTQKSSQFWGKLQNGFVRSYALVMLAGAIIIMTYLVLR